MRKKRKKKTRKTFIFAWEKRRRLILFSQAPEEYHSDDAGTQRCFWLVVICAGKFKTELQPIRDEGTRYVISKERTFLEQGKNLAREWKSVYACCSTHGSHVFLCFYAEAPRILGVLSADVSRDGDANLSCIVSCYPPSNITWKFNGKNLTRSARYEFIDSIYMLKVKNVQFVDAGLYECSLINELGEARANASLTVGCECLNYCSQGNCRFFPFSWETFLAM